MIYNKLIDVYIKKVNNSKKKKNIYIYIYT